MTGTDEGARLRALARKHGIQTSYVDVRGHRTTAGVDTLRALLTGLGVPSQDGSEDGRHRDGGEDSRPIDHVLVAWDGFLETVSLRLREGVDGPLPHLQIVTEDGTALQIDPARCPTERTCGRDTGRRTEALLQIRPGLHLAYGYHRLVCGAGEHEHESLVISAPRRCYRGELGAKCDWGLFAPLYALRGDHDDGAGSYKQLIELVDYTAQQGGSLVGTLPLLPAQYEAGGDPSPYLPFTRLLWSEFYVDADTVPGVGDARATSLSLLSPEIQRLREHLRSGPQVDYAAVSRLRRSALAAAWRQMAGSGVLRHEIEGFLSTHPHASRYAAFLAAQEQFGAPWSQWPEPAREGVLSRDCCDEQERQLRGFEQWLAHEQMSRCVAHAAGLGVGLYLDLPVGVHPNGYDTWHFRGAFVQHASTGAPPDMVFTTGQLWGSPPLHPDGIRERHYDYPRAYLEHHMRSARMLRIDHVMGLHRIYCIPEGATATEGAYLRYRPEEWYALVSLESHRHNTVIVGEDLGLVPGEVQRAMSRHGLSRMFVLYYEMDGLAAGKAPSPTANSLASLNTHDMPPFAAMWQSLDICQHHEAGIMRQRDVPSATRKRKKVLEAFSKMLRSVCPHLTNTSPLDDVLRCTLRWLGRSRARYIVVNVEDLWFETIQQNVPGVGERYPSWRHRAARTMEELRGNAFAARSLGELRVTAGGCDPTRGGDEHVS